MSIKRKNEARLTPLVLLRQVRFGTSADDTLAGGDKIDHLYGGNDIFAGQATDDTAWRLAA
ncbi:MAG: hypothetical protein K8F27_14740 [Sulfuricellaceae bacterium]|nr:hypothetical protein [Sulfuricellaceae bacterium]